MCSAGHLLHGQATSALAFLAADARHFTSQACRHVLLVVLEPLLYLRRRQVPIMHDPQCACSSQRAASCRGKRWKRESPVHDFVRTATCLCLIIPPFSHHRGHRQAGGSGVETMAPRDKRSHLIHGPADRRGSGISDRQSPRGTPSTTSRTSSLCKFSRRQQCCTSHLGPAYAVPSCTLLATKGLGPVQHQTVHAKLRLRDHPSRAKRTRT